MRNRNAYVLLGLVQSYAPSADAQAIAGDAYNAMLRENLSENALVRRMSAMLHDGLAFNNWPWSPS